MLTGDNVVWTPMYFSPEQTRSGSPIAPNLDLWAVGIMVFHCITGTLPLAKLGDSLEVIVHEIRTQNPRRLQETYGANPPPQLASLQTVLDRVLVKDAAKRIQNADQFLALLAAVPQSAPSGGARASTRAHATPPGGPTPPRRTSEATSDATAAAAMAATSASTPGTTGQTNSADQESRAAAAESAAITAQADAEKVRATLAQMRQELATAEGQRSGSTVIVVVTTVGPLCSLAGLFLGIF